MEKQQLKRKRNWEEEFYKNGYPSEVIVIADSPTPTPPPSLPKTTHSSSSSSSHDYAYTTQQQNKQQQPYPFEPAYKRQKWNMNTTTTTDNIINQGILAYHLFPNQYHHHPPPPPPPTAAAASSSSTIPVVTEPCDDADGHYIVRPNDSLTSQYKIMRLLGQGTFGKVVECFDRVRRTFCAIKIIRAIPKYRDASKIEIRVLNTLKQHDPLNLHKCIHLIEWFDHRNHICMVFELLGQSVFDYLKSVQFKPFPQTQLQQLAKQLLTSVAFLHDLNLVHTDLKPENILLVSPPTDNKTDIRLIDFGSATFEKDYHSAVVSTRHYRAPEIILGLGWSYPCDLWSIGCILVEFFTGDALFQTHDNLEHLVMMSTTVGPIPLHMIQSASKDAQRFFHKDTKKLKYTAKQSKNKKSVKPLQEIVPITSLHNAYFLDLLKQLLVYDPSKRITAREALRHPFFHLNYE